MASVGSFAAAKREYAPPAEPDTFEFCGETFSVVGTIPGMVRLTVGAWFGGAVSNNEGGGALRDVIRHALTVPAHGDDPEDDAQWQRFYELSIDHDVDTEDLVHIAYAILGAEAGRPTERRSTSSTGSSPTSSSSNSTASDSPDSPA
jgi:hypothetical protein